MEDITKNSEKKVNEGADKLRDGVEKARKQGIDLVERNFPVADEAIQNAKAKGEAAWDKAKSKGQDLVNGIEAGGQEYWEKVRNYVKKSPMQAVGYAIAAGLLIGAAFSFKKRD